MKCLHWDSHFQNILHNCHVHKKSCKNSSLSVWSFTHSIQAEELCSMCDISHEVLATKYHTFNATCVTGITMACLWAILQVIHFLSLVGSACQSCGIVPIVRRILNIAFINITLIQGSYVAIPSNVHVNMLLRNWPGPYLKCNYRSDTSLYPWSKFVLHAKQTVHMWWWLYTWWLARDNDKQMARYSASTDYTVEMWSSSVQTTTSAIDSSLSYVHGDPLWTWMSSSSLHMPSPYTTL